MAGDSTAAEQQPRHDATRPAEPQAGVGPLSSVAPGETQVYPGPKRDEAALCEREYPGSTALPQALRCCVHLRRRKPQQREHARLKADTAQSEIRCATQVRRRRAEVAANPLSSELIALSLTATSNVPRTPGASSPEDRNHTPVRDSLAIDFRSCLGLGAEPHPTPCTAFPIPCSYVRNRWLHRPQVCRPHHH